MKFVTIIIFTLFLVSIGCSSGSNIPVAPQSNGASGSINNVPIIGASLFEDGGFNALGLLGAYEITINPETNSAELIAKRTSAIGESYIVSGVGFFTVAPCADCLKINGIGLTSEGGLILNFIISHPFEKGNGAEPPTGRNRLDLDIFDLAAVIVPQDVVADIYSLSDIYLGFCVEPDGYTRELAEVVDDDAALPYYLVIDDSIDEISTWNKFEMGTKDVEFDTVFNASTGMLHFDMYLTMGYGFSAVKADRFVPKYYNPEFNRKAAWKVVVTPPEGENPPEIGNTWRSDETTAYDVTVDVYDWQQDAVVYATPDDFRNAPETNIYMASNVSLVSVEIPGMNTTPPSETTPDSGTGLPDAPLVFTVSVPNENLLGVGEYIGLVKVTDQRVVGEIPTAGDRDYLIDSPNGILLENYTMPEYATYQTFIATVVEQEMLERIFFSAKGCPASGTHIYSIDPAIGVSSTEQWTFSASGGLNSYPKISPCGRYIIYISGLMDMHMRMIDIQLDTDTNITPSGKYVIGADFSHDGASIAFAMGDSWMATKDLYTMNYDGTNQVQLTSGADIFSVDYSFDDAQIYCEDGLSSSYAYVYDFAADTYTNFSDTIRGENPHGSPDSTEIAFVSTHGAPTGGRSLIVSPVGDTWDTLNSLILTSPPYAFEFRSMCFSPDGTRMVTASGGGEDHDLAIYTFSDTSFDYITDSATCYYTNPEWGYVIPY